MNKGFTSIEQSKHLLELGLDPQTADMYYEYTAEEPEYKIYVGKSISIAKNLYSYRNGHVIPCWSLAALLGVLPQYISKYIESERCQKTFHLNLFRSYYYCCSYSFGPSISDDDGNNTLYCIGRDNWVDACVAMVEKLYELNLL